MEVETVNVEDRRRRRVAASHRIAYTAFRTAAVFGAVAVGWAVWVMVAGGSWWGPVHAFLLGTVSLAIAGATQLFTITWSAAPAPRAAAANTQRWLQAAGAAVVLVGVTVGSPAAVLVGGITVIAAVAVLASSLVSAVRHSLLRRFDLSARFYLLAIACAVVGVVLGILMGMEPAASQHTRFRVVHGHLNLVGLIGFTIIGTLPTILPTFAHHRAVSGREAVLAWRLAIVASVAMAGGLVVGERSVAAGTLLAAGALLMVVVGVVVRLGRTGRRGGLAYLQVVAGSGWLIVWAVVDGVRLLSGSLSTPFDRWIVAAVVAGVGQVLAGSLAYLIPVLLGPGPHLGRNFQRLDRHRLVPLATANGAAGSLLAGASAVAIALLALWVGDFARRLFTLERSQAGSS